VSGTILLLDDDPRMCQNFKKEFKRLGYDVETATNHQDFSRLIMSLGSRAQRKDTYFVIDLSHGEESLMDFGRVLYSSFLLFAGRFPRERIIIFSGYKPEEMNVPPEYEGCVKLNKLGIFGKIEKLLRQKRK